MTSAILSTPSDLEAKARDLEQSGDYKILRRLKPRTPTGVAPLSGKIGVVIDLETTGLDHLKDEIIEIGMVKFAYSDADQVTEVIDVFQGFSEPSIPIPAEITKLTGITDEIVAGQSIDPALVARFVQDANIVIAHNAGFDRKFAEKAFKCFEQMPWACSVSEMDWTAYGYAGSRLDYLIMGCGLFHEAHRAADDCHALLEILTRPFDGGSETAFSTLLKRARESRYRIWAERAPFDLKDVLKKRGYKWNDGSNGEPKAWHIEVRDADRDAEVRFLQKEIYCQDIEPLVRATTALERFSSRG